MPISQAVFESRPAWHLAVVGAAFLCGVGCHGMVDSVPGGGGDGTGSGPDETGVIGTGPTGGPDAPACTPGDPPGTTRFFRMTHVQYDNTIRALTGLDVHPSVEFPSDQNQAGFDRGMDLQVGDALGKSFRAAAESIAAQVIATPAAYQKVLGCDPNTGDACMRAFITDFGRRAYRRPLTDAEKATYASLFAQGNSLVDGAATPFQKGIQTTLQAFLQSPHFIF
ncbi:MAG: DUF1595 domain-containing protein, partial [Myxococcales bacterium]